MNKLSHDSLPSHHAVQHRSRCAESDLQKRLTGCSSQTCKRSDAVFYLDVVIVYALLSLGPLPHQLGSHCGKFIQAFAQAFIEGLLGRLVHQANVHWQTEELPTFLDILLI